MNQERLSRVRQVISEQGLDAILVSSPDNRRYLSGFTGTSGVLLISADEHRLLTDFRYVEQAERECSEFDTVRVEKTWVQTLRDTIAFRSYNRIGFEGSHLTYRLYQTLAETLAGVQLEDVKTAVDRLRVVKDEGEIALIRQGVLMVDEAFPAICKTIRPGTLEREVSLELEFALRRRGGEGMSFDTIVASGMRSALPHGVASDKAIARGDLVVLDLGVVCGGYASDFTRTVLVDADPEEWQRDIYQVVLEAQLAAIAKIRPGVRADEVDAAARGIINQAGYGAYFGHGTGHGLGLNVHEAPHLGATSEDVLEAGMVITVEPGIYLPGKGGVRIEDVAVVREDGAEMLTTTPNNFLCRV
ncbi:MAG: Xaa-Pro peptidase family protein [Eubacteriales bacterium]|nr:Xaa-Pro peptidase family protein [Bacillota bacterium]MBV1727255.1 Xaa-Pro peptidase family protein [Desulforudis sp.]MDQ7788479.1 Xaa-Pro peptidase family protein [Clostridia bacterium]MDZ4043161.1 Xaa-Pro peptidase family protein [Eubacteriales bacterium]MBU4553796.1 Xaa-Pro peptidase family protein [Bacillota bacterium]